MEKMVNPAKRLVKVSIKDTMVASLNHVINGSEKL
jgi:hypothetical protein